MEGLWVLGGNWNDILHFEERLGQCYVDASMRDFQSFVNDCILVDIPMSGVKFTWSNGQSNLSMSRLDRFLISSDWLAQFNQTRQWYVRVSFSDHHAVSLDPNCMACFQNAWNSSQTLCDAGFSLLEKFKNVIGELKVKFGKRFTSLVEEIKVKENKLFQRERLEHEWNTWTLGRVPLDKTRHSLPLDTASRYSDKDRECVAYGSPTSHFESFSLVLTRHNFDPRVLMHWKKHIMIKGWKLNLQDVSEITSNPHSHSAINRGHFHLICKHNLGNEMLQKFS
ncbi:hypothetical protein CTI12_AA411590 [Artemisia annua]|uniref:RNA-directed DNA polymerase, eukaryota, Reverse transcriptase zinc-binding domain protein n=1 Tax=Artemisia annua TaxID=35608 RepID=A0A2U1M7C9_ARTAN|nr:hypothetical protein CTI12_AA411590 [Artemisia annua]